MTGNIKVGIAAAQCIGTARGHVFRRWRVTALVAGLTVIFVAGWWINVPRDDMDRVVAAFRAAVTRSHPVNGIILETNPHGVSVRFEGASLTLLHPASARATGSFTSSSSVGVRYVDDETGQVTIANVAGEWARIRRPPACRRCLPAAPGRRAFGHALAQRGVSPRFARGRCFFQPRSIHRLRPRYLAGAGASYLADIAKFQQQAFTRPYSAGWEQDLTPSGRASVTVPSLDVPPGEVFPVRVDLELLRPFNTTRTAGALVQVSLDCVLFDDFSSYGPDKIHSRRNLMVYEIEARRDRDYFRRLIETGKLAKLQQELNFGLPDMRAPELGFELLTDRVKFRRLAGRCRWLLCRSRMRRPWC